jgi:hypothetical protein
MVMLTVSAVNGFRPSCFLLQLEGVKLASDETGGESGYLLTQISPSLSLGFCVLSPLEKIRGFIFNKLIQKSIQGST